MPFEDHRVQSDKRESIRIVLLTADHKTRRGYRPVQQKSRQQHVHLTSRPTMGSRTKRLQLPSLLRLRPNAVEGRAPHSSTAAGTSGDVPLRHITQSSLWHATPVIRRARRTLGRGRTCEKRRRSTAPSESAARVGRAAMEKWECLAMNKWRGRRVWPRSGWRRRDLGSLWRN